MTEKIMFIRPTLGQGGADRVTLTMLQQLDRDLFRPTLTLSQVVGEYVEDVPQDVEVFSLGGQRLFTSWIPLTRLLRQQKPDIVFSTSSGTNIIAVIAKILSGNRGRLVLSERNVLAHGKLTLKRRLLIWSKRFLYGRADVVTAVSQGVADDLIGQLGLNGSKVSVVYNPIVSDEMLGLAEEPLDHPWFNDDVPVVLGVGRLVMEKGFDVLIRAVDEVRKIRPIRLVILGDGELKAELQSQIDAMNLSEVVSLAGFDKNPFKYMANCTLFVLSSRHEGLPGVLIQAMACGAAVISTDCPSGPSEIITAGEDGILVDVDDVKGMAEQIEYLLDNPQLRQKFSSNGSQSAQRFRVDLVLEKYVAALRS